MKKEFVILRILPAETADRKGATPRLSDADIREKISRNVVRERNGDVWIDGIPMVDQGDKGYCAVAAGERLLRYYGIAVDSHELAELAKTERAGGTTWPNMAAALRRLTSRAHRSLRPAGGTPSLLSVSKSIDRGIPLIWRMYVTAQLEGIAADRLIRRKAFTAKEWKAILDKERNATRRIKPDKTGSHLRLIVGYNRQTDEIAYSDTWGAGTIHWITAREARAVSQRGGSLWAVVP